MQPPIGADATDCNYSDRSPRASQGHCSGLECAVLNLKPDAPEPCACDPSQLSLAALPLQPITSYLRSLCAQGQKMCVYN